MVYQGSSNGDYAGYNRLASLFSTGKWLLIFFANPPGKIIFSVSISGIWKHGDGAQASAVNDTR